MASACPIVGMYAWSIGSFGFGSMAISIWPSYSRSWLNASRSHRWASMAFFDSRTYVPSRASQSTISFVPRAPAMSAQRFRRSTAQARQSGSFEVNPPSMPRGSSQSRGATNSATSPSPSSSFLTALASSTIWLGDISLRFGTASSS